jgi:putative FmdB family regulatory protein
MVRGIAPDSRRGEYAMPIYEYRCNRCGKVSEILLVGGHSDDEAVACKHCGGTDLKRILSASSFSFADSGRAPGSTCCGRDERCDSPPCSTGGTCRRDQ